MSAPTVCLHFHVDASLLKSVYWLIKIEQYLCVHVFVFPEKFVLSIENHGITGYLGLFDMHIVTLVIISPFSGMPPCVSREVPGFGVELVYRRGKGPARGRVLGA